MGVGGMNAPIVGSSCFRSCTTSSSEVILPTLANIGLLLAVSLSK